MPEPPHILSRPNRVLLIGMLVFGAYQLLLGVYVAAAPASFFKHIGAFGVRNDHYTRDVATFFIALGVTALMAARWPSWRLPVLVFAAVQYALHTLNHYLDIDKASPHSLGPANAISLTIALFLLLLLLGLAAREERRR